MRASIAFLVGMALWSATIVGNAATKSASLGAISDQDMLTTTVTKDNVAAVCKWMGVNARKRGLAPEQALALNRKIADVPSEQLTTATRALQAVHTADAVEALVKTGQMADAQAYLERLEAQPNPQSAELLATAKARVVILTQQGDAEGALQCALAALTATANDKSVDKQGLLPIVLKNAEAKDAIPFLDEYLTGLVKRNQRIKPDMLSNLTRTKLTPEQRQQVAGKFAEAADLAIIEGSKDLAIAFRSLAVSYGAPE